MKSFAYTRPESIHEAIGLMNAGTRPLAGGTDLLTLMKDGIVAPETLLDIKRLPELSREIASTGDHITIGALATLSDLERNDVVRRSLPALAQAASLAASPQLRNMATIGGNVLQRPRCWYFRADTVPCWLKGGEKCYARGGENQHHAIVDISPCVAVHPSDLAPVLVAYGAKVQVQNGEGYGEIAIGEFFKAPEDERRIEHVLPENAVITGLKVPVPSTDVRSTYLKAMDRKAWAFALAGVAVMLEMRGGVVADSRIVLGGVAPVPHRATEAEHTLLGSALTDELIADVADAAVSKMTPLEHNGYKIPLVRGLVKQALGQLSS
jgi:xanthine dehydrogenase YagS FAD-binding subunit